MRCPGWTFCSCPSGLNFPPAEVEAARVRVLKRRIRRRIEAMMFARLHGGVK